VGLTGGIASGKSTTTKILKSKKIPVHDSDLVVTDIYEKPNKKFIDFLKRINLKESINKNKIDKKIIREVVFSNKAKKKQLEDHLHLEVKKSRERFLKKQKRTKANIVFLDIPLLFEKKLNHICDYVVLLTAPISIRKKRALKRKGMSVEILNKILKTQLVDGIKKKKANFIINTSGKKSLLSKKIFDIINEILEKK
jgi:dephospho-CoA kinase